MMENRYADLSRIIFMLNYFILFLSFTGVTSAPATPNIIDIMKNDSKLECPTSKFLYDSEYIKPCTFVAYPTVPWEYEPETLNHYLCLGVYDTAYKICQYSSYLQIPLNSTVSFNSYVEKYVPNKNKTQEDFCKSLQGFVSLYNKTNLLWKKLVESLNKSVKCQNICFGFQDKFHPLCAVFAWIKTIDDEMTKHAKKVDTQNNLMETDKPYVSQSKNGTTNDIKTTPVEFKKKEIKEASKEQNREQITDSNNNNNSVKEDVLSNAQLADVTVDEEKTKSDIVKANNIQKKINNTFETQNKVNIVGTELDTNAEVAKPIKNIPTNSDSQTALINEANTNKKHDDVHEENVEKVNKEQDINDLKPSTLSENTQDHYDAENPEDIENDIDDVDDTLQHPDTENQNENVQKAYKQKNNNRLTEYSNGNGTDGYDTDGYPFFMSLLLTILVFLAGYIGYHNRQKILAIVLEGRSSRNSRGRRRPSTASYRKLDCTLEEAVTSQCNANVTHVIY